MADFYKKYSRALERSVSHIFTNLLGDSQIQEVYQAQTEKADSKVWIEIDGTFAGEVIITLPQETLKSLTKKLHPRSRGSKSYNVNSHDVMGEIGNLVTGTFANQLQYIEHEVTLSPPEFDEDPISMKALYNNINLSFSSTFGGFDVDVYYKDQLYT